jgi:uncharacterized protein YxjI
MSMLTTRDFTVDQRFLSVRNTYVIKNKAGEQLGFIKQEIVSWGHLNFGLKTLQAIG